MFSDSLLIIDDDSPLSSPSNDSQDVVLKTPPAELKALAHKVFVALPRLSAQDKLLYKPMNKSSFGSDFETRVDEVIGEYREGIVHYYFARYDGGIAYKV
jgi:chromodomain-helicase-DNA-binding protein 4